MIADEYENARMETGQKLVSFSAEDEILEIESRRSQQQQQVRREKAQAFNNQHVKARLGIVKGQKQLATASPKTNALLHRTLKTVRLKPAVKRETLNLKVKTSKMKSDEISSKKSIKSRLNLNKGSSNDVRKIADRIGRVKLSARIGNGSSVTKKGTSNVKISSTSVFDRLGFNK